MNHTATVARIYSAPESERTEIVLEELEEWIAGVRDGTYTLASSTRWRELAFAPSELSISFTRNEERYA